MGDSKDMAEEDDIERLLREVDASTGGGAKGNEPKPSAGELTSRPRGEVESEESSGLGLWEQVGIAAAAGALVTFLVFLIPFIGSFGALSRALAGAVGGAVGYGVARAMLNRGKSED